MTSVQTGVVFTVPGAPEPKRRARATTRNGHTRMRDPQANQVYADRVRWAWTTTRHPGYADHPVAVTITAQYPRPKNHHTTRGDLTPAGRRAGRHWCPQHADTDNLAKAILDALNGLAWEDDRTVTQLTVTKIWVAPPGATTVHIRDLSGDQ